VDRALPEYETEPESTDHDLSVVASGDEHDRGVESLCVGEAA